MSEVGKLLQQSWDAHKVYRMNAGDGKKGMAAKWPVQQQALQRAYECRAEAHALDPEHTDPAWGTEQEKTHSSVDTHTTLIQFYQKMLAS